MPLALPELQSAMAAHLRGQDRPELVASVHGGRIAADGRLAIYRNHVRISLTAALAASFPVVQRLVGETFFAGLAYAYIRDQPPRGPVLAEYGEGFADFISAESRLAEIPYLGDVARLEWALNLAWQAPRPVPLQPADLAGIDADAVANLVLRLQPGTTLLRSRWPIDRIWQANRAEGEVETLQIEAGECALLVIRRADDAAWLTLSAAEAAFVAALAAGGGLSQAANQAMLASAEFDLGTCLARLLASEVFAALN